MNDKETIRELLHQSGETLTRQEIATRLCWPLCRVAVALDYRGQNSGIERVEDLKWQTKAS